MSCLLTIIILQKRMRPMKLRRRSGWSKTDLTDYADADVCGDSLLNKAENGSTSWKATHDQLAAELASIGGGVPATAVERKIPFLDATTLRRGDLMTWADSLRWASSIQQAYSFNHGCASWTRFHNSQSRMQTKMPPKLRQQTLKSQLSRRCAGVSMSSTANGC